MKNLLIISIAFLLAVIFVSVISAVAVEPYDQRIEEKYNIEIVEILNQKYGGGYVVFKNEAGELCSADMAKNDVLVGMNCEQP